MIDITKLHGSWDLLSWRRIDPDGTVSYPYTEQASGRLFFDPAGTMAGFLMEPTWKDGHQGADKSGFLAYSAHYELHGSVLHHRVDFASNPRMIGVTLRRQVTLEGDDLTLETLATEGREANEYRLVLEWRRA